MPWWVPRLPADRSSGSGWQDRHWDVIVVGAGVSGLTTGLLLARSGLGVLILDAIGLGAGTTGRSTAKVSVLQSDRWSRIADQHGLEVLRDYVTANLEGRAWLADFCDAHGVSRQARTAYTYATTDQGAADLQREHGVAREVGHAVEWLAPDLPFPTTAAIGLADQFQLDPGRLLQAMADEAVAHGATVAAGARVTGLRGRGPLRLETTAGQVAADKVVLATNLPILDRGAFFASAVPGHSHAIACRTREQAVDGMYLSIDQPTRSLRDADGEDGPLLLVGGNGHVTGRGGDTSARVDDLVEWTRSHYPDAEPVQHWSARDYTPAAQLPWAGPLLPGREDVLVLGGYAKWGFTNSAAASLALTARILGDSGGTPSWASFLEPWHPRRTRGVPRTMRAQAEVALAMGGGWVRVLAGDPLAAPRRRCTHLGGPLSWNEADQTWDCPLHASRFGADGAVLEGPATRPLPCAGDGARD